MKTFILVVLSLLPSFALKAQDQSIEKLLKHYLDITEALIKSDAKSIQGLSQKLVQAIEKTDLSKMSPGDKNVFSEVSPTMLKSIKKMAASSDLEKQRFAFSELSPQMWNMIKSSESIKEQYYYDYCPMKKAYWISEDSLIRNPYYGSQMLRCGSIYELKNK